MAAVKSVPWNLEDSLGLIQNQTTGSVRFPLFFFGHKKASGALVFRPVYMSRVSLFPRN